MAEELKPGTSVKVRQGPPEAHCRTPCYLRGKDGVVLEQLGSFHDPSKLAFHKPGLPRLKLYRVLFHQRQIWPERSGPEFDTVVADLYEHWLIPVEKNTDAP